MGGLGVLAGPSADVANWRSCVGICSLVEWRHADAARIHPVVPIHGDRRLSPLVMVHPGAVPHSSGALPLYLLNLGCAGICGVVWHCADARIRPCAGVPVGGRPGRADHPVAAGRRGVCEPAAAAGCHLVEYRRRAAGERDAGPGFSGCLGTWPWPSVSRNPCPTSRNSSCR